jgi:CysZ protein
MGFFRGVAAFFQGMAFVVGTRRIWPRAAVPVLVALVLMAGLGVLGLWGAQRLAHRFVEGALGASALTVLFALPALLVALVLALALAQPLSGWALDGIVRAQRNALGMPALAETSARTAIVSSLGAGLGAFVFGAPLVAALTIVGWAAPPALVVTVPLKFVVAALLVAWDLLDYPLAMHGLRVRERLQWSGRHFGAVLGFGLAATLFFGVPGLGLLVLPGGVAGAARLVRDVSRRGP